MKKTLLSLALGLTSLAFSMHAASAVTITNGGFEDSVVPAGSFTLSGTIPGWKAIDGSIEVQDHVAGNPAGDTDGNGPIVGIGGHQFVELDSDQNSIIESDAFTTSTNSWYTLSFLYSNRPGVPAASNGITAKVGGNEWIIPGGLGAADTVWVPFTFTFQGLGNTSIIFEANGTEDSLGGYIDNVSVSAVPEGGATLALLGSLMGGMMIVRRFKK